MRHPHDQFPIDRGTMSFQPRSRTVSTHGQGFFCGLRQLRMTSALSPRDQAILYPSGRIEDTIAVEERGRG